MPEEGSQSFAVALLKTYLKTEELTNTMKELSEPSKYQYMQECLRVRAENLIGFIE